MVNMVYQANKVQQARTKEHTVKWKFADYDGNGIIIVLGSIWCYMSLEDFLNQYNTGYDADHLVHLLMKDRNVKKAVWRTARFKWAKVICNVCQVDEDAIEVETNFNNIKQTKRYCKEAFYHVFDKRTIKLY